MQNKHNIIHKSLLLLLITLLLGITAISVNAAEKNEFSAVISSKDNYYVLDAYIKTPQDLTNIDFSVFADGQDVIISGFITEGSDSERLSFSTDNLPDDLASNKQYFTYFSDRTENKLSYSGFFVDFYTATNDFFIGRIVLSSPENDLSEHETITVTYTLSCEHGTKTAQSTFFLKSGKNTGISDAKKYPLGDADLNGKVTATDARIILRAAVGLDELDFLAYPYANSDCDDKISASDARYALRTSVGLENTSYRYYAVTLGKGATCENGGTYIFTDNDTHSEFSMTITKGEHIKENTGCFDTGKCTVCNETVFPETPHAFNKNGICTFCGASESLIEDVKSKLIPILEEISSLDALAYEALKNDNYDDYLKYTMKASQKLKDTISLTKGVNGLQTVHSHLEKAFSIRFSAFMECTDSNGKIRATKANCTKIHEAVKESNKHIDYASYLED